MHISESPFFSQNHQNLTAKHLQSSLPNDSNLDKTRLNYQYYRSLGGTSFSSNFNARRAYLNNKYMMRQINQRSFDEFVPSGMMPKDMRVKLPNIPGVTEKTINGALRSGEPTHLGKGLRTAKSSMNKMQSGHQTTDKKMSPTDAGVEKLKNCRKSSNLAPR